MSSAGVIIGMYVGSYEDEGEAEEQQVGEDGGKRGRREYILCRCGRSFMVSRTLRRGMVGDLNLNLRSLWNEFW